MKTLIPEQVMQEKYEFWVKVAPTRIKKILTEEDREPDFFDLEGRKHEVKIGRCICVGIEGERWTCSISSLERDRYPVGEMDEQGYQNYLLKSPRMVRCFDISYAFRLATSRPWECPDSEGGIITWNGETGTNLDMRVIKRSIFEKSYELAEIEAE